MDNADIVIESSKIPMDLLEYFEPLEDIKSTTWRISTKPFSGAHFAVFPPDLIETPIKATCPEQICTKCGFARKLVYEETRINTRPGDDVGNAKSGTEEDPNQGLHMSDLSKYRQQIVRMPKFGGNKAEGYGNPTYSGKEWEPVMRRLKSMGADDEGEYHGESTKDYESAMAQDASETKKRIIEGYKKRANSQGLNANVSLRVGSLVFVWIPSLVREPRV